MAKDIDNGDYEIIPHQVLHDLTKEVAVLKEKLTAPDTVTHDLVESMHDLKANLANLQSIFSKAMDVLESGKRNKRIL